MISQRYSIVNNVNRRTRWSQERKRQLQRAKWKEKQLPIRQLQGPPQPECPWEFYLP
jgi:hypothetical protein